jgi:hypothetical protein
MSADEDARQTLTSLMVKSLAQQRVKGEPLLWKVAADRGKSSEATLRRIRKDPTYPLTERVKVAIEDALGWLRGDVDRILTGGTYTYRKGVELAKPVPPPLNPRTSSLEDILEFALELHTNQPQVFKEFRQAVLDVAWLNPKGMKKP